MKNQVCEFCRRRWEEHTIDVSPSKTLNWLCPPPVSEN